MRIVLLAFMFTLLVAAAPAGASTTDRIEELQQQLDSVTEDVEDLQEPVAEFELFDECTFQIGVSEYGSDDGLIGYAFGRDGARRRQALALDIRGFGRPDFRFLAFPAEEPPSIECNEDAGEESSDN